jgi:hypothetical protein
VKAEEPASKKSRAHVHFIAFGGFNSSKIITDFDNKKVFISEAKRHFNFGGCFRFEFGRNFYLQPEVYLTRKGGLEKSFRINTSDSVDEFAAISSVDMPIIVGLRLFDVNKFAFRMYGGPVVSFLQMDPQMNKLDIFKNGQRIPLAEISQNARVFSMQAGAGFDIMRFTLDVRYEYAFSPMYSFSDFKTRHKILYFTLGIKIF